MTRIVFVVLHYETLKDTKECISSLLNLDINENMERFIIVVDNGSKISKIDILKNMYLENKNILFIRSDKNLGFAKGNNLGYSYAKQHLAPTFIILINNDTVIEQKSFLVEIVKQFKIYNFHIAGPQIVSSCSQEQQNPVVRQYYSIKDISKRIYKLKVLLILSHIHLDVVLQRVFLWVKDIINKKRKNREKNIENIISNNNFQLHGCCFIFSYKYIQKYDGLYDETFMYGEENILKYISVRDNLVISYCKDIIIKHKEASSTQSVLGKGVNKRQFYYKWNLDSCHKLLKLIKEDNEARHIKVYV